MGEQKQEQSLRYIRPPKLRQDYLLTLVFVLMAGIILVGWLPRTTYFNVDEGTYLTLHIVLMFFSTVVSFTVFVAAWYDFKQTAGLRELVLCITFLMVGLIDIAHTLSYEGLPDFFTENSLNKSTIYWVFSRIVESIGLGIAVIISPVQKKKIIASIPVGVAFTFTVALILSVAYQTPYYPDLFSPEIGQTKAKVFLDYLVIFIKGTALYYLIKKQRNYLADHYLQAALIFGIFSEAAFTLYTSAYDGYNFVGHVYKIFEFAYIMKALFVLNVVRLYQTNTVLQNQKRQMADINVKLEKANRLKNDFLTNTNHELRTPLTSIIAFTELLQDEETGPLNEVQRDYINEINESGQQLLNYINNLLDLSKIESGKMELYRELTSIEELIKSITKKTMPIFWQKEQTLSLDIPENLPSVYIDPPKFSQILTNLLSNAHKFTPPKGQIAVQVKLNNEQNAMVISVADTGIGISEEDLGIIFEKFKQVNGHIRSEHPGTGLGLTLVRHLVELHGGMVQVSSALGEGSTFSFRIPLVEGEQN